MDFLTLVLTARCAEERGQDARHRDGRGWLAANNTNLAPKRGDKPPSTHQIHTFIFQSPLSTQCTRLQHTNYWVKKRRGNVSENQNGKLPDKVGALGRAFGVCARSWMAAPPARGRAPASQNAGLSQFLSKSLVRTVP